MVLLIRLCLLLIVAALLPGIARAADQPPARFSAMSDNETWQRLPLKAPSLPAWARILAGPLPKATGALLTLDSRHRADNPIGNMLAGQLRWIAADAIGCQYARACAESDLLRNGVPIEAIHALRQDDARWSPIERATFQFAEKMTLAAYSVTDAEVAALTDHYGPITFVGIVHTLAFANFENRLFLALGVAHGDEEPVPPQDWSIDLLQGAAAAAPERPTHEQLLASSLSFEPSAQIDWSDQPLALLDACQLQQQQRPGRVPIPDDDALSFLPPEQRQRSGAIIWSRVSLGYQPELTGGWFSLMDAFREESKLDRVFSNTLFWIVTRNNQCFY
jgi:alkylhydroperoxidase family enzyme